MTSRCKQALSFSSGSKAPRSPGWVRPPGCCTCPAADLGWRRSWGCFWGGGLAKGVWEPCYGGTLVWSALGLRSHS